MKTALITGLQEKNLAIVATPAGILVTDKDASPYLKNMCRTNAHICKTGME